MPLAGAAFVVLCGVATNQVLDNGKLSWNWAYLAFGVALLGALVTSAAGEAPAAPDGTAAARGEDARRPRITRRAYMRRVWASVADMETIGVVTQGEFVLRTRQVYVDVALQPRPAWEAAGDSGVGVRPQDDPEAGRRGPLASFLKRGRVLAVLGAAGSGKTTMARYTALELAERHWKVWRREFWRRRHLPVLLYLRDHTSAILAEGEQPSLAEVAVSARWLRGPIPAAWLEGRLDRGRCVVLLDGLDEVADGDDRRRVAAWVTDQIARYSGNAFVLTSRPHGYRTNPLYNADILRVQQFTADQISRFLHSWYRAIERRAREGSDADVHAIADQRAEDLIGRLRRTPALYDLAANPLLLTMTANVHRYRGALPAGRAALYAEMCDVLLHRRQEAKNLTELPDLDGPKKELVMQVLALHMMRHRLRHIFIADAKAAIGPALGRVSPGLSTEAFLDYIRRTGLLVEREHDEYAFAHLTLQEYLAAARVRQRPEDLRLLTDGVEDPWWRETTLLWSTGTDASPVVRACLASGAVHALGLAFGCADLARDLDPGLRERLDQILTPPPDADPERLRLIAAIIAARDLHDTVVLRDGARICAQPVSRDLWNQYARYQDGHRLPAQPAGSGPATGIWAVDVPLFLDWINDLGDNGAVYRLPTPLELSDHALPKPCVHAYWTWTEGAGHARLHRPGTTPHPYRPAPGQLADHADLIIDRIGLILWLSAYSPLPFSTLHAYAQTVSDDFRPSQKTLLIRSLDLIAALQSGLVADNVERARALAHGLGRDLPHHLGNARGSALSLAQDLTLNLTRSYNFSRVESAREIALALAIENGIELDRYFGTARAFSISLIPEDGHFMRVLHSDLDRRLNPAIQQLFRRTIDRGKDIKFDREFQRTRDRDRVFHRALHRALTRECALESLLDRDLGPDHALALALGSDLGSFRPTDRDLAFSLALARILHSPRQPWEKDAAVAGQALFLAWVTAEQGPGRGKQGASFRRFLAEALAVVEGVAPADDPLTAFRDALASNELDIADPVTIALFDQATSLVIPLLFRYTHADREQLILSSVVLLAVVLRQGKNPHPGLVQTLGALIALIEPSNSNEALLLVRE